MDISAFADWLGIFGFFLTLLTFIAALNVRSKIVHLKERQNLKSEYLVVSGKLLGYVYSLEQNNLDSDTFFRGIDIFLTDILSRYTFLRFPVKLRCRYISRLLSKNDKSSISTLELAKQLTSLNNAILKEVES